MNSFLFLLFLPIFLSSPPPDLYENTPLTLNLSSSSSPSYFKFLASPSLSSQITLLTSPSDLKTPLGILTIYLSTTSEYPNSLQNEEACLQITHIQTCSYQLFPSNASFTTLYIGFYCESPVCKAQVRLLHLESLQLSFTTSTVFKFTDKAVESFKFNVPTKGTFTRIVISILARKIKNSVSLGKDFQVEFECGKVIKEKLVERLVFVLDGGDDELCFGRNNSMVVTGVKESVIEVESFLFGEEERLVGERNYCDFLFSGGKNLYMVEIGEEELKKDNFTLFFAFKSLSGTKKRYAKINLGKKKKENIEKI